jgi:hypothetical protein
MTVATSVPNTADTDETRAALRARAFRGLELHEARGSEIVRTGPFTYLVPSCSGGGTYAVNYKTEACECPDYEHSGLAACKHLFAVGIHRAARRSSTAAGLAALEEAYAHEIADPDERCEMRERIVRARRLAGL